MKRGNFFVLDGGEGTGTTTLSRYVVEQIKIGGGQAHWTKEPGGSDLADKIRELILNDKTKDADAETMFALFWAARRDHLVQTIIPFVEGGMTVVSDRFDSSTWAYQIRGQEQPQLAELFVKMREHYLAKLLPDRYIILDAPPEVGCARVKSRGEKLTHFDERDLEFHTRVRQGFLEFSQLMGCTVLDASQPLEVVKALVLGAVRPVI